MIVAVSACASPGTGDDGIRPGVQLYTVRADMERDPLATVRRIAAMGYREVEFAGTFDTAPDALCHQARADGLTVAASHADWRQFRDDPQAAIDQARALCTDTVILAWTPPEERQTLDQWRGWIASVNRAAKLARGRGMRVAYHAHDFEFHPIDGVRPIDLLMTGFAPDVGFELDTYWVAKGGDDPLAFLKAHADRVTHLHHKDMAADGSMADVGTGTLPMAAIIAQARRQGVRHFLVERDDAPDPWASLATSLDSLRAIALQQSD